MAENRDSNRGEPASEVKPMTRAARGKSLVITAVYIIFGCAWILLQL